MFCRFFAKPWAVSGPNHARALLPCGHETHARTPHRGGARHRRRPRLLRGPALDAAGRAGGRHHRPRCPDRQAEPGARPGRGRAARGASPQAAGPRRNYRPPRLRPSSTTVRRQSFTSCTATAASTRRRAATAARASMTSQLARLVRAGRRRARLLRRLGGNCGASVGGEAGAGPADRRTRGSPASASGRVRPRQADRGRALDELPPAAGGATCNGREPRPDASICPGRQPAPARRHEVVMKRRAFHAMGTTVELVLDARRRASALSTPRSRSSSASSRSCLASVPPRSSRASTATGSIDASPELAEVVGLALDARERTGGASIRRCTMHSSQRAMTERSRSFRPTHRSDRQLRAAASVELDGRHITLADGVRLDLGGIGKGYAAERVAELLALAGPCLVSAGGDVAVRGLPAGRHVGRRGRRVPHPRPRTRRPGDVRHRPAALAERRRRAAPSDRPANGPTCSRRPHPCDRHRRRCRRRGSPGEDALAVGRGRGTASPECPPCC